MKYYKFYLVNFYCESLVTNYLDFVLLFRLIYIGYFICMLCDQGYYCLMIYFINISY